MTISENTIINIVVIKPKKWLTFQYLTLKLNINSITITRIAILNNELEYN